MTLAELLETVHRVELKTNRLVNDTMVGAYLSHFKGRGMDFEELRDYIPGDDVRDIDWNVTYRMGRPFVKRFREERELGLVLAVDVSGSYHHPPVFLDSFCPADGPVGLCHGGRSPRSWTAQADGK